MDGHSDWYLLFSHFWWLVFPLAWLAGQGARLWLRHRETQRMLDMLQTFVSQGKEPPPQLLEILKQPDSLPSADTRRDRGPGRDIFVAILFAGIAAAFTLIAINDQDRDVYFVVIIMAALAVGFVVKALLRSKPLDPP